MRILFDTNVVLDLLLDREPHATAAARLVSRVERGDVAGTLCATAVTTIHYLVFRELGRAEARRALKTLLRFFGVASVTRAVLESALEGSFDDYEDAVVHEAARAVDADAIVTRNVRDFRSSQIPVYTPDELVAALDAGPRG